MISNELLNSVKSNEGFRSKVYEDTLGFDTIGYGFAIKDLVLDEDIALIILTRKLERLIDRIENKFEWFCGMPNLVQDVIVEMCYQLGISGFSKFKKTIGYLQTKQWVRASIEMLDSKWARQTPNRAKHLSKIVELCTA